MNPIITQLFIQLILILINAFFAMSEIAIISLNTNKLKAMIEDGDKQAELLLKMVENPNGFLSTIQIGITLAGFLGSAFAADSFSGYVVSFMIQTLHITFIPKDILSTLSIITTTLILAYFTLILGELVPKRIAMQRQMEVSKLACNILSFLSKVTKPIVSFLSISTNIVLKVLGLSTEANEDSVTEEDILLMTDIAQEKQVIQPYESQWIENVFDFNDVYLKEIMTRTLDTCALEINTDFDDILQIIRQNRKLKQILIYEDKLTNITKYINVNDFLLNVTLTSPLPLTQLFNDCMYVPEVMKASKLFEEFKQLHIRIAIVVNEYGETVGMVTMEDLIEEIVGNIFEDSLEDSTMIKHIQENVYLVNGLCPINDLEDTIDQDFQVSTDIVTVGGLVLSHLENLPKDGSKFDITIDNLLFHILHVEHHQIKLIAVELPDKTKTQI